MQSDPRFPGRSDRKQTLKFSASAKKLLLFKRSELPDDLVDDVGNPNPRREEEFRKFLATAKPRATLNLPELRQSTYWGETRSQITDFSSGARGEKASHSQFVDEVLPKAKR